jgi:hypothetical protein
MAAHLRSVRPAAAAAVEIAPVVVSAPTWQAPYSTVLSEQAPYELPLLQAPSAAHSSEWMSLQAGISSAELENSSSSSSSSGGGGKGGGSSRAAEARIRGPCNEGHRQRYTPAWPSPPLRLPSHIAGDEAPPPALRAALAPSLKRLGECREERPLYD